MRAVSADLPFFSEMTKGLEAFGLTSFRPGQAEVVSAVLSGRNTVVVMPTGAGKSLCYQLPATLLDGVTVVISPLIALMQDQVESLSARGIPATFINSTLSESERADRQRKLRTGEYKLVYVAPERFRSEAFVAALTEARVALYAIDEAHCISQWGHDFRPDYALLGQVRKRLRPPRTVALTATATPEVRDDISRVLLMKEPKVFVAGFDRPNLFLEVLNVATEDDKRRAAQGLAGEGSGIIYCSTRKQAETMHQALTTKKVDALLYHAGMADDARREAQDAFMQRSDAVAVATNAFGMGIDKPGIRFVAHAGIPRAVEAYYQEIGRAGRDGNAAHAVLLFNHADVYMQERLIQSNHPPETLFRDLWRIVRQETTFQRGVNQLASQLGSSEFEVSAALKVLEREGLLSRGGRGEGRWTITMLPGSAAHHPRSPEVKALWTALLAAFPIGSRNSTELSMLSRRSGLDEQRIRSGLSALERAGAIQVQRPFTGRTIHSLRDDGWDSLGVNLERVRAQERNQLLLLKRMTEYAYTKRCRRGFLLRYFGEQTSWGHDCGSCDVCAGPRTKVPTKSSSRSDAASIGKAALPQQYSVLAVEELKRFRRELSHDLGVPPFIIFNDATLYGLAASLPTTKSEFVRVKGTGEAKWERFGAKITQICLMAKAAGDVSHPLAAAPVKRKRAR
jgi:ATP-dependent DNA helicase RecQ